MPEVTISEFAADVGVPVERIQEQLVEAGLPNKKADEVITDSEKSLLLGFLRKKHGKDENSEPRKITLRRKTISELKVPVATQGSCVFCRFIGRGPVPRSAARRSRG